MREYISNLPAYLLPVLLALFVLSVQAKPTSTTPDDQQDIIITASSLKTQQKQHITEYKGNAVVSQGSLTLKADVIIIFHPNDKLKSLKATGKPASFKRFSQVNQAWLKGKADTIEYDSQNKSLLLTGHAEIKQFGKYTIKGNQLFYDINLQTLHANSSKKGNDRVSVTFKPIPLKPTISKDK